MVKPKIKKGTKLACIPCGRKVVVDSCGISQSTIWCCGKPMQAKVRKTAKAKK